MMERVFGFDIGTTSIGFAVIDLDSERQSGRIHWLGVRIFPEARDPDGTPLNQQRRAKRMMRRQLRRRRQRRRTLNEMLHQAGLLPRFDSASGSEWSLAMRADPYDLRRRGLAEPLTAFQLGRALYHLAQRRHFKGREIEETNAKEEDADEKKAGDNRTSTLAALRTQNVTLGTWLAAKQADATKGNPPKERRRGVHADRNAVEAEFGKLLEAQAPHHPVLRDAVFQEAMRETIFFQRPVFWRRNTLGQCRLMPGEPLCPRGSWLSQQRRMLEKLNNLALAGGNQRPLGADERQAILAKLETQSSVSWAGVRAALKPLYVERGEKGAEKALRFNLELGGEKGLPGNAVEQKLAGVFGAAWAAHPHRQAIRDAVQERLWAADYGKTPDGKRVVILPQGQREARRREAAQGFVRDFGVTMAQAEALARLTFPAGWEPFSSAALRRLLPELEEGLRFGALLAAPEYAAWRDATFPNRERPTGEVLNFLPSPAEKEEQARIAQLRNPTVVRVQNELRKVVNNLIRAFGKPDRIRVELARDVGRSKRQREEDLKRNRDRERERKTAERDLRANGIADPSREDIEKWLLWQECGRFDPYSALPISFDDLFANNLFQVEHIWPRSKSLDNGYGNKTLCHRDWNARKNNRMPFDAFGHSDEWAKMKARMWKHVDEKRMKKGKAQRFCREEAFPDDFVSRQLNDTGYAARQAVAFLKRLWPDEGAEAPVTVQAVSGRVTAQLRRFWQMNNILSDDGEKTRADHRHHAVDALVVACARPGITQRLSQYWQAQESGAAQRPNLPPPWPAIRADAEAAIGRIVVSHRVRKKVSGPLHAEQPFGYTGENVVKNGTAFGIYVKTMPVEKLPLATLQIDRVVDMTRQAKFVVRDAAVRHALREHLEAAGGDLKKAYPPYPTVGPGGAEVRSTRVLVLQQRHLMVPAAGGFADPAGNHHVAIYLGANDKVEFQVVTLFEAARRLARREPVIRHTGCDGARFIMSLAPGDALQFEDADMKGLWIVKGVWANGQVVMGRHDDATEATTTRPSPGAVMKMRGRKVSVDPIGRARPARD